MYIFGLSFWGLLKMMPPPDANLSEAQVANFYLQHGFQIRVGAMISSWVSAFGIPIAVVSSIQLARLEKGTPVWSILSFAGGLMMSIFLSLKTPKGLWLTFRHPGCFYTPPHYTLPRL